MEPKLEITNLITPLIGAFRAINNEWKNLLDIGLMEYLNAQTEKYYFTNTFIHRSEKVRFYDIYYPIKAKYKALITDFENLQDVFEEYKNITLVGSAGSGKTTLMKHIFLQSIKTKNKIPILIELRNLNEYSGDLESLIAEKIVKTQVKPTKDIFKRTLKTGKFLFLLDGYDEIFSTKKQDINRQIELFMDSYSNNNFLITTRPGSGIEGFQRFHDFAVCDLSNIDVDGFIKKIVEEKERRDRILGIVKDPKNDNYIEYLRNPLLLSMFIMAFESHPEIPAKKSSFYRNVFDTLYSKHDGITKNSWPREKLTKLQRDDFEIILNIFSYLSLSEGQYAFTEEYLADTLKKVKKAVGFKFIIEDLIYDLRTTISILTLDGFEYHFPHRSLQEYFTAQFISNLPSDKKAKAYNNLFEILEKSSADRSFNLWSICNELDFTDFTTNFIIPKLREYERLLNSTSDEKKLVEYLFMVDAELAYTKFTDGEEKEIRIVRRYNFFSALIRFCNIYEHRSLYLFPGNSGASDELIQIYLKHNDGKIKEDFFDGLIQEKEIIAVLLKYGIIDLINEYKKLISKKIIMYEKQIDNGKACIDSLLNFD